MTSFNFVTDGYRPPTGPMDGYRPSMLRDLCSFYKTQGSTVTIYTDSNQVFTGTLVDYNIALVKLTTTDTHQDFYILTNHVIGITGQ